MKSSRLTNLSRDAAREAGYTHRRHKRKYFPLYRNYGNGSPQYYRRIVDDDQVWELTKILLVDDVGIVARFFPCPVITKIGRLCRTNAIVSRLCTAEADRQSFLPHMIVAVGKAAPGALRLSGRLPIVLLDPRDTFIYEDRTHLVLANGRDVYEVLRRIIAFIEKDVFREEHPRYHSESC